MTWAIYKYNKKGNNSYSRNMIVAAAIVYRYYW